MMFTMGTGCWLAVTNIEGTAAITFLSIKIVNPSLTHGTIARLLVHLPRAHGKNTDPIVPHL